MSTAALPSYAATITSGRMITAPNLRVETPKRLLSPGFSGQSDDSHSLSSKSTASDDSEYAADPKDGAVSLFRYRHDPYGPLPSGRTPSGVALGVSHQPLVGTCTFVQWPDRLDSHDSDAVPPTAVPVHFEQIKFELSPGQLRFVIFRLAHVIPVCVRPGVPGSFTVYARTADDAAAVRALHRRCLFDQHGVWAPANGAEKGALARYMSSREFRQRGQRLPRELMTIARSSPSNGRPSSSLASSTNSRE